VDVRGTAWWEYVIIGVAVIVLVTITVAGVYAAWHTPAVAAELIHDPIEAMYEYDEAGHSIFGAAFDKESEMSCDLDEDGWENVLIYQIVEVGIEQEKLTMAEVQAKYDAYCLKRGVEPGSAYARVFGTGGF
jgi:hypothetical protein